MAGTVEDDKVECTFRRPGMSTRATPTNAGMSGSDQVVEEGDVVGRIVRNVVGTVTHLDAPA
jgi:hypothetical protein